MTPTKQLPDPDGRSSSLLACVLLGQPYVMLAATVVENRRGSWDTTPIWLRYHCASTSSSGAPSMSTCSQATAFAIAISRLSEGPSLIVPTNRCLAQRNVLAEDPTFRSTPAPRPHAPARQSQPSPGPLWGRTGAAAGPPACSCHCQTAPPVPPAARAPG